MMGHSSRNAMYLFLPDNINHEWERADGGDNGAIYAMMMYFLIRGIPEEAYYWAKVGAESGDAICMLLLAEMHLIGYGAYLDRDIAEDFYRRALEKGEAFDARCTGALAVLQKAFPEVKAK
jgi:TPR repeat protein